MAVWKVLFDLMLSLVSTNTACEGNAQKLLWRQWFQLLHEKGKEWGTLPSLQWGEDCIESLWLVLK